jgi:SSS family solute:Na+ symporter
MSSAALSTMDSKNRSGWANLAMVLLGGLIAARGQSIIDTMVALNMVYLGAIGVVFVALSMRWKISAQGAWLTMLAGFAASLLGYALGWAGWITLDADLMSLVAGVLTSLLVFGMYAVTSHLTPVDLASHVRAR